MKKWIAIFFILALTGTFLPAVISYEQRKVVLFSTVEEEQTENIKQIKGKQDAHSFFDISAALTASNESSVTYSIIPVHFISHPLLDFYAPPPDLFC